MKTNSPVTSQQMALLLGAALCEQFTSAQIVHAWGCRAHFFTDIVLETDWDDAFLPLVERKMGELLAQELMFEEMETSVASASGLFSLRNQELLKAQLPNQKNALVQVLRFGDWAMPLQEVHFSLQEGRHYLLQESFIVGECEGQPILRVIGALGEEAKDLKKPVLFSSSEPNHIVEQLGLLQQCNGGWIYLPRGEYARFQLIKLWQDECRKENFSFISTPLGRSWEESCQQLLQTGVPSAAQMTYLLHEESLFDYGVLTAQEGFGDLFCRLIPEQKLLDVLISSLQMMRRIHRIFSFETQVVLRAPQSSPDLSILRKVLESEPYDLEIGTVNQAGIEIRIFDRMGRAWSGPKLEIAKEKQKPGWRAVVGSMLGSWERLLALLVQREQGIPLKFIEEQARIFAVKPDAHEYAREVQRLLEEAGLRCSVDQQTIALSERIHQALKERVPYLIVVGLKEQASQQITWRSCVNEMETTTTLGEFVNMVKH